WLPGRLLSWLDTSSRVTPALRDRARPAPEQDVHILQGVCYFAASQHRIHMWYASCCNAGNSCDPACALLIAPVNSDRSSPIAGMSDATSPSRLARAAVALAAAAWAAAVVWLRYHHLPVTATSDFDAAWAAARALRAGADAYAAIQSPPWPWTLQYPLP